MKSEKQSKLSLLLSKKPITECVTKPGSSLEHTKFWECSDDERNHTIELMQEYDYTEDDYGNQGFEVQYEDRDAAKPSLDDFYAVTDFMEQTGMYNNVTHPTMVDTGRYVEIEILDKDTPATMIAYESVPSEDKHEFWQVDGADNKNQIIQLSRDEYEIKRTLETEEAVKYQNVRDNIAFEQQIKENLFPKKLVELALKMEKSNTECDVQESYLLDSKC